MLEIIQNGSIVTWQHINLYGEYDFTKTDYKALEFDLEKILRFEVRRWLRGKERAL